MIQPQLYASGYHASWSWSKISKNHMMVLITWDDTETEIFTKTQSKWYSIAPDVMKGGP